MARIEKSIQVDVPVQTAYNQWTQFEEFPRFMEGIQEVHQVDDERLSWVADVGGERKEWYARITQQVPDEVVAWESEGGTPNAGIVTFQRLGGSKTEVNVQMDYEPEDFKEALGDKLGFVSRRVEGDLKRFKEFIEERGVETGGWRGEIKSGEVSGREPYERKDYEKEMSTSGTYSPSESRTGPAEAEDTDADLARRSGRLASDAGTGPDVSNRPMGDDREVRPRDQYGTEGSGGTNYGGTEPGGASRR